MKILTGQQKPLHVSVHEVDPTSFTAKGLRKKYNPIIDSI
jgi:hypothetical protein